MFAFFMTPIVVKAHMLTDASFTDWNFSIVGNWFEYVTSRLILEGTFATPGFHLKLFAVFDRLLTSAIVAHQKRLKKCEGKQSEKERWFEYRVSHIKVDVKFLLTLFFVL